MPVTVQCTQCQSTLSLDEGFAGGVARCNHCGTLVAVPRATDEGVARSARPAAPAANPDAPRRADRPASDFGGSSASLISPRPLPTAKRPSPKGPVSAAPPAPPAPAAALPPAALPPAVAAPGSNAWLWVVAGVVVVVLVVLAWLLGMGHGHPGP